MEKDDAQKQQAVNDHLLGSTPETLEETRQGQVLKTFVPSVAAMCCIFIGLLFGLTKYATFPDDPQGQIDKYYQWFMHVNIMIFVGFGFLMTFIRRYSYGAVSLNMAASAMVYIEAILCIGACQQVFWNQQADHITVDIPLLIDAAFCAGSCMIAFGAVIGKTTPTQLLWMMFAQVPIYALNQRLVIHVFKALDMGGTIVIHLFGAYYGLAASWVFSRGKMMHCLDNPKNASSYLNNVTSMIGTLFLFLYWPSFNGAMASVPLSVSIGDASEAMQVSQFLCVVNTFLSLLGATFATFAASALVHQGRFNMVHVQNSTIAGGVAMGAACTLQMTPGGALLVGMAAGVLSVVGFTYLTPYLDHKIGLADTCGIHNLHGMPAILGGFVAAFAALGQDSDYLFWSTGGAQFGNQMAAIGATLGIGLASGALVGYLLRITNPAGTPDLLPAELFDDGVWWTDVRVEPILDLALGEAVFEDPEGGQQDGQNINASTRSTRSQPYMNAYNPNTSTHGVPYNLNISTHSGAYMNAYNPNNSTHGYNPNASTHSGAYMNAYNPNASTHGSAVNASAHGVPVVPGYSDRLSRLEHEGDAPRAMASRVSMQLQQGGVPVRTSLQQQPGGSPDAHVQLSVKASQT